MLRKLVADQQGPQITTAADIMAGSALPLEGEFARKVAFEQRLLVLRSRHLMLLRQYVARFYKTQAIQEGILAHVDTLKNLLKMTTQAVAVGYNVQPSRSLRDVDENQQRIFLDAYRDGEVDLLAEQWNRYAFALNVVHVIPRWVNGALRMDTILPHNTDALTDDDGGERDPSILIWRCKAHGATYVAADAEQYQWLDSQYNVMHREPHGLGMVPWVAFRWEAAPEGDYWDRGRGQDLLDGTLKVSRIYAQMCWVRKSNSKNLLHIHTGEAVAVSENQTLQGETPFTTEGQGAARLAVADTIVACDEFLKELREVTESVLEAYGLPSNLVDFSTESTRDAANVFGPAGNRLHDALAKLRDQQVKSFERAEYQLAIRIAHLLRAAGVGFTLTDAAVRLAFRIKFAPLSAADPTRTKQRMEAAKAQIELGQTSPYELYQQDNPECTLEEARECVNRNVKDRASFYAEWIEHGVPADPSNDLRTAQQLNGAMGGIMSGESRSQSSESGSSESTMDTQDEPS